MMNVKEKERGRDPFELTQFFLHESMNHHELNSVALDAQILKDRTEPALKPQNQRQFESPRPD